MFKMLAVIVIFTILYFFVTELWNLRKKSKASKMLDDVRTAEELFEIEREVEERERKLAKKKEALYSKDEVTPEV